jgi:hypothetical protein
MCSIDSDDARSWIARDIQNFKTCEVDSMLQQILNGCALDPSDSLDQKSALFQTCLEAVLPLCNETSAAQDTKELLSE